MSQHTVNISADIRAHRTINRDGERLNRGWYICDKNGTTHLFNDGVVRFGCRSEGKETAFWPTWQAAVDFYNQWKAAI